LRSIREFFAVSYRSDPTAFYLEMCSFGFSVVASAMLSYMAADPVMWMVYPLFLIGSTTQAIASYRRRAAWVMMITIYFSMAIVFGLSRSLGWF
jgi:hypothetical protein